MKKENKKSILFYAASALLYMASLISFISGNDNSMAVVWLCLCLLYTSTLAKKSGGSHDDTHHSGKKTCDRIAEENGVSRASVSYTHLDVYKRQVSYCPPHYIEYVTSTSLFVPRGVPFSQQV